MRECPAEEFRIVLVQSLHRCVICLATAHSLAPGSVQVDCLDEEQFDEEQQDGENPVEGSQTVRAQPLDRCGTCLATGRSLVPGSVQAERLDEEHLDGEQQGGEHQAEEFQTALIQSRDRCEVCLETVHSLVPGLIQAEGWDESQVQVECLDEEQWYAEHPVVESQTALVQPLPRCEVCLEFAAEEWDVVQLGPEQLLSEQLDGERLKGRSPVQTLPQGQKPA